jgi:hypothetical protein
MGRDLTGVLQGEGKLAMTGGTLEVLNALEPSRIKFLAVVGGTFTSAAEVFVSGSFEAGGLSAWMTGTGKTIIEAGATGVVNNGPDVVLAKQGLENAGTLVINTSAGIDGREEATLVNSGTLTVNGDSESTKGLFVETGGATLTNKGTVQKTEGTGVTNIAFTFDNENNVTAKGNCQMLWI